MTSTLKPRPHVDADLVIIAGSIYTMDPLRPLADGVAIVGDHILAVGGDAEIRKYIGPKTRVIDLAGRALVPGLVDGHCHLYGLGKSMEELSLRGVTSANEVGAKVAEAARGRSPGEWIEGRGWDQNLWTPADFPDHAILDAVAPQNPVALRRIDGHALWANHAALAHAGITRTTPDPPGGRIVHDAAGEPTGVLVDNAMALVEKQIPAVSAEVRKRRILAAAEVAIAAGLTGVHEMGIGDETIAAYRELAAAGKLKLRVYAFLDGTDPAMVDQLATRRPERDVDGRSHFVVGGIKLFADGALGSRGAALLAPYSDDPSQSGLVLESQDHLDHAAAEALRTGWQLAVHAIGDRANRMVLDAIERAHVPADRRFRIEHAQIVSPADIARFGKLGVIASMQPSHATSDMPWAEARLGHERLRGAYAWRSMLAAGARLAFGSDFPIEDVPVIAGIYAAVTRTDAAEKPEGGWLPEQILTLTEALHAYTVGPAYASFEEGHHGTIAPGYMADLTVFDHDLVVGPTLLTTRIDLTIVGGAIVYQRTP